MVVMLDGSAVVLCHNRFSDYPRKRPLGRFLLIHQAGAKIGIGIRSGKIHIEPERPRTTSIIPITTEMGAITGIKTGIIRPMGSCRSAGSFNGEPTFIGSLNVTHPAAKVSGQTACLGEGISGTIVFEVLEGRLDVAGIITINSVNPPKQVPPKIFNAKEAHLLFVARFSVTHTLGIGAARSSNTAVAVGVAIPKGRLPVAILIHDQVKALKQSQRVEGNKLILLPN